MRHLSDTGVDLALMTKRARTVIDPADAMSGDHRLFLI